jgi:SecD/SecF fusion protein
MSPVATFFAGVVLLFVFFAYLGTTGHDKKKLFGTLLTVLMSAFCAWAIWGNGIKPGIDIGGGSSFTVQLQKAKDDNGKERDITSDSIQQAIGILEKRLNPDGGKDLIMAPQGKDRITLNMPGVSQEDLVAVREKIQQVAHLEFRIVRENLRSGTGPVIGAVELPFKENADKKDRPQTIYVSQRADMEGKYVKRAFAYQDPVKGWAISLEFDSTGADLFDKIAEAAVGKQLAVIVDGVVISAPTLQTAHFGGRAEISGQFKEQEARQLATALENPLENPMSIIEESSVSAAFGAETVRQGEYTGIVSTLLIAVFMIIYYRLAGVVALFGVIVNILMIFGAMALFNVTLTMPGIAGIALTVGMGVDANVLIYERLREEMKAGKSLAAGLATAFEKAFAAIFDVHVTTFITSMILFYLASGLVKGFAITLTIGIFGTLFGSLIVTRVVFGWFIDNHKLDKVTFASFLPEGTYNMLSYAKPFIIGSFCLMLFSLLGFVIRDNHGIGIDFRGGAKTRFSVTPNEVVKTADVEKALTEAGIKSVYVEENTAATGLHLISVRSEEKDASAVESTLEKAFVGKLTGGSTDTVGAVVGSELAQRSILAYIVAMIAILIYLAMFYEFSFAVGAIIALAHDCVIVVGLSVLLGQELSIIHIGAVLTVAGYSINDTIIVFDRIREMIRAKAEGGNLESIMNEAISVTLSRTILTSLTALVPMVVLYFFGGPSMKEFSLPILIGIVVGTYSSIYIASPLVLWWANKTGKSLQKQILDTHARKQAEAKPIATT